MPNNATIDLKATNEDVKKELQETEAAFQRFGSSVKKIAVAVGAAWAAKKILGFASELYSLYETQQQAEVKLEAVVKATGQAAGFTADQMKQMASDMQSVTTVGDEVIVKGQTILATFKEIKGDQFRDATKAALDMAGIFGSVEAASMQLGKALNDPTKGIAALSRAGVSFTDEQKKVIQALQETGHMAEAQNMILAELKSEFGGVAEAMAEGPIGRLKQFKNRLGDIGESLIAAVLPALEKLIPLLEGAASVFEWLVPKIGKVVEWNMELAASIWEFIKPAFEWLAEGAITIFTGVQTVIQNWKDVAVGSFLSFELVFVKVWENLKYYLGDVIPQYLEWFGRNWKNVFENLWRFTKTVFSNMWDNIKEFFSKVWAFLRGGDSHWHFKALEDGFESTLEKLPDIAKRKKGAIERALEYEIGKIQNRVGNRYNENLAANRAALGDFWDQFAPDGAKGEVEANAKRDKYGVPNLNDQRKIEEERAQGDSFRSGLEDLLSLNRRITQAAAGGGAEARDKKMLREQEAARKAAEKQAEFQAIANQHLRKIANATAGVERAIPKVGALQE